jgi:VIT1/CCC1 family predicted Fe2+/Mn2+ transporter
VLLAFSVNMTWGIIDGVSVMHTNVIARAQAEKKIYDLRTKNDAASRQAVVEILGGEVTSGMGEEERNKLIDLISRPPPGDDPAKKKYYPGRDGWSYALGIFAIDTFLVIPLVVPLFIWSNPEQGLYVSRLVATVLFAILGAAYARNLNRRMWLAALFLGTLALSVASLAYLAGW